MAKLMDKLGETLGMSKEELEQAALQNADNTEDTKEEKRIIGKIIKVSKDGYGFISSKDIPFTRIFFHWTSLKPGKLKFTDLVNGTKVSFVAFELKDKGYRAIKVKVEDE